MRVLDEQFLFVHPRTRLWQAERQKCQQCKHLQMADAAMRCRKSSTVYPGTNLRRSRADFDYCIDAREPDGVCGPDATLFEAA